jgi:hypothetical protein
MEGGDPIVSWEKSLPHLPQVPFYEIMIATVLRVDHHQSVQVSRPNGLFRSIEDLLNVTHRLSICLEIGPYVDSECARCWNARSKDTEAGPTRVSGMKTRPLMRVIAFSHPFVGHRPYKYSRHGCRLSDSQDQSPMNVRPRSPNVTDG